MRAKREDRQKMMEEPTFAHLRSRLERVRRRYHSESDSVSLAYVAHGDADLYPALIGLARDGLLAVQQFDPYFLTHELYDDGGFWYRLCEIINGAAERVQTDHAQAYIPAAMVDDLLDILCQMSRYAHGGDMAVRMFEALANTLLTFHSAKRVQSIRAYAVSALPDARRLLKGVIARVSPPTIRRRPAGRQSLRQA